MISRTNAVKMSTRKWEALSKGEDADSRCGFCAFVGLRECEGNCPLYPDVCTDTLESGPKSLYRQWLGSSKSESEEREIALQILNAIKERGEKWIRQ